MSEVEFKKFAICDTCGVEALCRKDGEDDQCGGCYWAPINHAKHEAELAALREELAACESQKSSWVQRAKTLGSQADDLAGRLTNTEQRLADAERRNADLSSLPVIAQALKEREQAIELLRLNLKHARGGSRHSVEIQTDNFLKSIDAALKPTESGASE